ncbi:TIGR04104 family putative zinc finger protein [Paraliobacillus ryukyuensis]|uniref:TIGR04104 family putative zinc finger protein n=1 Tax=Paraliobacillus ryukyuensis TaxID=200904 RepID=UPI0009A5E762|nr:TIGR04104 family putative zinc finger protein [Paraliobacillus ryukyuensis]
MPHCQHCGTRWKWMQTLKTTFTMNTYDGVTCPYCGEKQYQTKKSRRNTYLLYLFFPILFVINLLVDVPSFLNLVLLIIFFISAILLFPRILKLSSENELVK